MNSSYLFWSHSPFRHFCRAARTSAVCGKLPIVVVGRNGSRHFACCLSRRCANSLVRSAGATAACTAAARTATRLRAGSAASAASARRFSTNCTGSGPSLLAALHKLVSSSSFCSANASASRNTGDKRSSPATDTGTCCKLQEGCTISSGSPAKMEICFNRLSVSSKSVRQIFRPSISPAPSVLPAGNPYRRSASRFPSRPCTKSSPKPCTGRSASESYLSTASKYVCSIIRRSGTSRAIVR
ncbi:hypothetical protein D3C81_1353400 [compost metagenome]